MHAVAPESRRADECEYELVRQVAAGDAHAFETMMRRYNQRLYRAARSILKNDADAQEAVQEAYWKAYCNMGQFRAQARLSTWLTRIAVNEALMRLRQKTRQEALLANMARDVVNRSEDLMQTPERAQDAPDAQLWRSELRHLIEHHIDALPAGYRSVFLLRAVEDMSTLEVAQALDMPEATVRTRFFRARGLLQAALGKEIDLRSREAFSFDGLRCDAIVHNVLARLAASRRGH